MIVTPGIQTFSTFTSSIGEQIFVSLAQERGRFDCLAARLALRVALQRVSWKEDYWTGLDRPVEHDFIGAIDPLMHAWDGALKGAERGWCLYPGLALIEALRHAAGSNESSNSRHPMIHDVVLAIYAELVDAGKQRTELATDEDIAHAITTLDSLSLPVAPWQYETMLAESLSVIVRLRRGYGGEAGARVTRRQRSVAGTRAGDRAGEVAARNGAVDERLSPSSRHVPRHRRNRDPDRTVHGGQALCRDRRVAAWARRRLLPAGSAPILEA